MLVRQLFDRESSAYSYLIADPAAGVAALIDPVLEQVDRDLELVGELELMLTHVLDTHVDADHVTGADRLRELTGARTCASAAGAACVDVRLADCDVIQIGAVPITALATPGHTDDGLSYLIPGAVFTGDTLLIRGCGRADLQDGDPARLYDSITRTLFALPDDTIVYPGHDYRGHTTSTIGEEKRLNHRVAHRDRARFVELMAVPAHRACGLIGC